jgi:hypothetical protein
LSVAWLTKQQEAMVRIPKLVLLAALVVPLIGFDAGARSHRGKPPETTVSPPTRRTTEIKREDLEYFMEKAVTLSGYEPIPEEKWPTFVFLSAEEMAKEVCKENPSQCRAMVAFYDTDRNRVLVNETYDMKDNFDGSFVVHELTHALQHHANPDTNYEDCNEVRRIELEAYKVQNLFLERVGQIMRVQPSRYTIFCAAAVSGEGAGPAEDQSN